MIRINGARPDASANGHKNGSGNGDIVISSQPSRGQETFDKPVILRQSPHWSRAVVWGIMSVTAATLGWACVAQIEQAVPAQGKLEPEGIVQPVQAPVGGVIQTVHVSEGQAVEAGDVLVSLDPETTQAQLASLKQIRDKLQQENAYYRAQQSDSSSALAPVDLTPGIAQLTSNRAALIAENALYRAQLNGDYSGASLSPEERQRLSTSLDGLNSRLSIAQLEVDQLQRQLTQVTEQLANARRALQVQQDILVRIQPLYAKGAIAQIPYLQQEQEVSNRQSEVNRLVEEEQRIDLAIVQAEEQAYNTLITSQEDIQTKIAQNTTQIANIDSQLTKTALENEKQLQEVSSQIAQLEQTLLYQELRAPVSGTVFNLKANKAGYVANSTEPILEIVPGDSLVARVFITNRDIGFVHQGMPVDVRVDSFPYSEYGDVKGTVVKVASDALPPDQVYPFYRFPVEVELERQALAPDSNALQLQSGMSVSANIRTRKRTVIAIVTDLFVRKIDSLQSGG
ncbi:MAG: HlyD family type I secretion periplasmic adaptor subunit [Cyanobacteria bacterium Co-bin13]|nr:HlyD family type I secretion periplasmic adaptor subunit [Cyanobacteria bacterium Co-bin13]